MKCRGREDPGATRNRSRRLTILRTLVCLLPLVLFFSYYPIIPLGSTSSMNLELSLPLIWLAIFTFLSLPTLVSSLRSLSTLFPKKFRFPLTLLLFAFPIYLTISILWSPNPLRGLLTAGIFWCLILSILTIPQIITYNKIKTKIVKIILFASVIISAFCWLQCILDLLNVPRDATLLCEGCTYRSFGFPHPNGFAIEPQFMGNLLLAPCFLSLYLYIKRGAKYNYSLEGIRETHFEDRKLGRTASSVSSKWDSRIPYRQIFIFLTATLFLTFSRGAIYAFCLGLVVLIIANLILKNRKILKVIPLVLISFLISLLAQGTFAQLSPTTDTFASGINKVINHLSLGHLTLAPASEQVEANGELEKDHEQKLRCTQPSSVAHCATHERAIGAEPRDDRREDPSDTEEWLHSSQFNGYVKESTEVRVSLTNSALSSWQDYKLFGSGLGSSGTVLYDKGHTGSPKEIVQNEYATLLLETGLLGCLLLLFSLAIILKYVIIPLNKPERAFLLSLELAFAATLFFFSGLPNALHIYLLPVLIYPLLRKSSHQVN